MIDFTLIFGSKVGKLIKKRHNKWKISLKVNIGDLLLDGK